MSKAVHVYRSENGRLMYECEGLFVEFCHTYPEIQAATMMAHNNDRFISSYIGESTWYLEGVNEPDDPDEDCDYYNPVPIHTYHV